MRAFVMPLTWSQNLRVIFPNGARLSHVVAAGDGYDHRGDRGAIPNGGDRIRNELRTSSPTSVVGVIGSNPTPSVVTA